jgi:folate-dependent phosphoribosylglycinamide formyltransferase PurN
MLNIHPSLLPSFPGLDPHGQALRAGVKISGATVHFVIPETDAGPIVMQGAVAVRDDDTPETLAARILESSIASIRRRCGWSRALYAKRPGCCLPNKLISPALTR